MDLLENLIQRCHQRHQKPLRQRQTVVAPALDKGRVFHFMVHCARQYPVRLYELQQAHISAMPIGRAPNFENGPRSLSDKRAFRHQRLYGWSVALWKRSWGLQVCTGTPSERDGAQWHDLNFRYEAICAAPDAVLMCIKSLVNAVVNPLLTLTKSGGLRFSCRVLNYLHPNTDEAQAYIYKHTPTDKDPQHRDVYLEILGESGYSRWDARYEILLGNLLDPPIIARELLFASIDPLRDVLHQPVPVGEKGLESAVKTAPVVPFLDSHNLNLANEAFLRRGFTYRQQEAGFHRWYLSDTQVDNGQVSLWEDTDGVWVRASTPNTGLPTQAALLTDVWDDTGILPSVPAIGLSVNDKVLAVREGSLSPLAIKRPSAVVRKPETDNTVYGTLEENAAEMQRVFNADARILGLTAETGAGKNYGAESYVLNGGAICLNAKPVLADEAEPRFEKRNVQSVTRWRPRKYLWEEVEKVPVAERMTTPFQRGNVCEDAARCDALEEKGGNPSESICPQCPVYTECQERGYLSQSTTLKHSAVQILQRPQVFVNPRYAELVGKILTPVNGRDRLCIVDEVAPEELFIPCNISKKTLEAWAVDWQGNILGNFANELLNALEIRDDLDDNVVGRIRAAMQAFEIHEETLVEQMCQVNIPGKIVPRDVVDAETGQTLIDWAIEFEGGISGYIPLDDDTTERLMAEQQPHFLNIEVKVPMSMTQAIELGILDTTTLGNIQAFPTVYQDPNWTLWHQLKRFFAYYRRDADAPILWSGPIIEFWVPPILHPNVKRLLFMSSSFSERDLHRAFPDEDIEVTHIKPPAWVTGNRVFQIRTDICSRHALLNYDTDWDILGMSQTGQRLFLGIAAEIERDSSVKHAIITTTPITKHLRGIAAKENVCLVTDFKAELPDTVFEAADVTWIVSTPQWNPGLFWRRSQILFGNEEKPLCYEGESSREMQPSSYKDERVHSVYKRHVFNLLTQIVGKVGLGRLSNKTVVLLTDMPPPNITDRPETLLFDWEDFEIAGGLEKLPEVIAEREHFETARANLTAASDRRKVQQVLGISKTHANRLLMKLRGGKIERVPFHTQICSLLSEGEKTTAEIVAAIDGHPNAIKNELKSLVDSGEIVKVRRAVYAIHK